MKIIKKTYEAPDMEIFKVDLIPDALNTPSQPDNANWDWNDENWGSGGFNPNSDGPAPDF